MPAVQRAGGGLDLRLARHPGRAGRRRLAGFKGQKVWTTWAHLADHGLLLARTDPAVPKRRGITYFLIDSASRVSRSGPLRHLGGEVDFNEVFLDGACARRPAGRRCKHGWRVAGATLSGERQMAAAPARAGRPHRRVRAPPDSWRRPASARPPGSRGGWDEDPVVRQRIVALLSEERIRAWTNQRVRAGLRAGRPPGAESSRRRGPPGRPQPAHPAAGHRPAGGGGAGLGRPAGSGGCMATACPTRWRACSAAGPTRSRAAPPRSTRRSWASGCWGHRRAELQRDAPGTRSPGADDGLHDAAGGAAGAGRLADLRPARRRQCHGRHHAGRAGARPASWTPTLACG